MYRGPNERAAQLKSWEPANEIIVKKRLSDKWWFVSTHWDAVPIFTATRSSVRHAGEVAAGVLIETMTNPNAQVQTHMLEAELLVGSSTGPVMA